MQSVAEELTRRLAGEELLEVAPLILPPAAWTVFLSGRRLRLALGERQTGECLRAPMCDALTATG